MTAAQMDFEMPVTVLMYFLFWYFNFWDEKNNNTEYIIEMRDAACGMRDKAPNFGTVPQNAGRVVTLTCLWDHFILNPDNVNCKHCYDVLKIKKRSP